MRKSLWIILTALFVAMGASNAHADTCAPGDTCTVFTIAFINTSDNTQNPTGTMTLVTDPTNTNIGISASIVWEGLPFSFPSSTLLNTNEAEIAAVIVAGCGGQLDENIATAFLRIAEGCTGSAMQWFGDSCGLGAGVPCHLQTANFSLCAPILSPPNGCTTTGTFLTAFAAESDSNLVTFDYGTLSVSPTVATTPEPGTCSLMLIGIGLLFVMRKRINQGLQQAA